MERSSGSCTHKCLVWKSSRNAADQLKCADGMKIADADFLRPWTIVLTSVASVADAGLTNIRLYNVIFANTAAATKTSEEEALS
jgi:hypothetical protein